MDDYWWVRSACWLAWFLVVSGVLGPEFATARPAGDSVATFVDAGDALILSTGAWRLALRSATGEIIEIQDRSAEGVLARGSGPLWVIERHEQNDILSSSCALRHRWDAEAAELTLQFTTAPATVTLTCRALSSGPSWQAEVQMREGALVGWRFPAGVAFEVSELEQVVFPDHLGLAFSRRFFEAGGAGSVTETLGAAGLERVAGDRCDMRPVRDPAVSLHPGRDAEGWLPAWYRREMAEWRVCANRCPAGTVHDLSLVECEHGSWLSAYRLGGWGWLFRIGGMTGDAMNRPVMASVAATLARVYHSEPGSGTEIRVPESLFGTPPRERRDPVLLIGIVAGRPSGRPGARRRADPERWRRFVAELPWAKAGGIEVEILSSAAGVQEALADPRRWFAIVNTLGEAFPAISRSEADSMLDAIREYVRHGGIWWEAGGGYPFYRVVFPGGDASFSSSNRSFCDVAAVQGKAGMWVHFGVQAPDSLFVPFQSEIRAVGPTDERRVEYQHRFQVFADAGTPSRLPVQRMVIGTPHREALLEYARANGFRRGLAEKAGPELAEKLKRLILLKVTTRDLKRSVRVAQGLPYPVIFHIADYLHGGFDRQYPDHLPPHPGVGTGEDLARLIAVCRDQGHVFMPYTNPTWWCVHPKGPTFEREGEAPLARTLEGKLLPERYGASHTQGYTTCAWHPAVRSANEVIRRQFTETYPVGVLFQDQVGARGHRWDTNPAAPHPGAYLEGIHRTARQDAEFVPVGTEDGIDRLINCETLFCGLSFPWLPNRPHRRRVLYEDLWPEEAFRIEPLALFLAHDKVLFYHHDLGGFVRNRLDLSVTVVMGYGLSWWTHTDEPSEAERDWIDRLCRVQAAIGPRCAGRPLTEFTYEAPKVIRSQWGDLDIVANLRPEPWTLDASTVIAPEGFAAKAPDLEAGVFIRHPDVSDDAGITWLIRRREGQDWATWRAPAEKQGR